jgi:hypothetical protein
MVRLLIISFLTSRVCMGQTQTSIRQMIGMIKDVPFKYKIANRFGKPTPGVDIREDTWYGIIKNYDSAAIKYLIPLIADTTTTNISSACIPGKYRRGDIAVLLINEIEPIPYATVTNMQGCVPSGCGTIPEGFFSYISGNRLTFQAAYQTYFHSKERLEILKSSSITHQKRK